ncbi:MAG: hypothetical protein AB7P21_15990 [Lautropia sp.]
MSAPSDPPRSRRPGWRPSTRGRGVAAILGAALVAGTLGMPQPAAASLTADLSEEPPAQADEAPRLRSSDPRPAGRDAKDARPTAQSSGTDAGDAKPGDAKPGNAKAGNGKSTSAKGDAKADPKADAKAADTKDKPALRAEARSAGESYLIRCWQEGRLVFEESVKSIDLAPGRYSTKFQGKDRNGSSVYIADTRNATCLIKGVETASDRVPTWLR